MYYVTKNQWNAIPDEYKTETSDKGGRAVFEGSLRPDGQGGTTLLFEHENFEILPDDITSGDALKDSLTSEILEELSTATPEQREEWTKEAAAVFADHTSMCSFINTAAKIANDIADRAGM